MFHVFTGYALTTGKFLGDGAEYIALGGPRGNGTGQVSCVTVRHTLQHCSTCNRIGGVMVSDLAPSVVDRGFESRSGQTKDYKIGSFSVKHAALSRMSKDGLARNQDNVSEWGYISIRGLLFQLRVLV